MLSRAFLATLQKVVDPVVLESVAIGVKSLRLSDQFHFFVVVGSPTIRGNHGSLKVGMLEVCTLKLRLSLLLIFTSFALFLLFLSNRVLKRTFHY